MKRPAKIALGVFGALTAVSLAIHVPMLFGHGHPVGAHGSGGAGCPFGFDKATPGATTAAGVPAGPVHHDPRLRGNAVAAVRPALGFVLAETTRAEIERAVAANGGACKPARRELECTNVPVDRGPTAQTAWFTFAEGDRLDAVRVVRSAPVAATIGAAFATIEGDLTAHAGAPSQRSGSADPTDLARGALRQASVEYRFANYRAVVRATNVGPSGFVLTEDYQNLVD